MISHLTSEEISKALIGDVTREQQQHVRECSECGASLERVKETFLVFRESVHMWAGTNDNAAPKVIDLHETAARFGMPRLRWAVAGVVLIVLLVVPFYKNNRDEKRARQAGEAQARQRAASRIEDALLLEQVNASLSRNVPAPMEPLLKLVSDSSVEGVGNRQ
jgi:hypothetical protein